MKQRQNIFHFFIFFSLFFSSEKMIAQNKLEVYQVNYRFHLTSTDSVDKEVTAAIQMLNEAGPAIKVYTNEEKTKMEDHSKSPFVQVTNWADSTSFKYFTRFDSLKVKERISLTVPEYFQEMKISFPEETQVISGYTCNLARLSWDKPDADMEILIWYVKGLPKIFFSEYEFLLSIPGLPLKVIAKGINENDFEYGLEVLSIEKRVVESSFFEVPEEYRIIE
ncbi:hypothetical protein [Moheibacter sp.]|uniref:hypothetical protein n=1 Tax=Moheibacter sp. TaxID=1965316 RepID=UPI003C721B87